MARKRHEKKRHTEQGEWTEADIHNILLNPIYAGVGSYPAIVSEETYLAATARMIQEMGADH